MALTKSVWKWQVHDTERCLAIFRKMTNKEWFCVRDVSIHIVKNYSIYKYHHLWDYDNRALSQSLYELGTLGKLHMKHVSENRKTVTYYKFKD